MSASWSLADLRTHISGMREPHVQLLEIVDSIDRYVAIFRYHLLTARDAMKRVVHENDPHGIRNIRFVFATSEKQDEYYLAKIVSEANILGCIHSTRALFDVFSHLVNGLLLNGSLPLKRCDIKLVTESLPESPLKGALEELLASFWFNYISAFVNTAKHRSLVRHSFHVSFVGEGAGIRIEAFAYNGDNYPAYSIEELLQGILEVKNKIVDCGRALNAQLPGAST